MKLLEHERPAWTGSARRVPSQRPPVQVAPVAENQES